MIGLIKRSYIKVMGIIVSAVSKMVGPIHAPFTHKNIDYDDVLRAQVVLQPGDGILTRTNGELTTLVIPGFWKHAIVYIGNGRVIEAIGSGVRITWLANVMMKTDNVAIVRKRGGLDKSQQQKAIDQVKSLLGRSYDYYMNTEDSNSVYCSELLMRAVDAAVGYKYFELMDRMGFLTITPDDCYNARGKMEVVWEKRQK